MNKFELVIAGLAGIGIIGLIVLAALGKALDPIVQIVMVLISFLLGTKEQVIAAKIAAMRAPKQ